MSFETLNRIKWKGKMGACSVSILHRGAPEDRKIIDGKVIKELKKSYFTYQTRGKEGTIPLHRVLEIRFEGETVWKRKAKKG